VYRQSQYYRDFVVNRRLQSGSAPAAGARQSASQEQLLRPPARLQAWTLVRRCVRVKCRDTWGTAILLAQAPVVALLIVLVFAQQAASDKPEEYLQAKPLTIFLTGLAALWFGCSNAAREIVGEWAVFRRERMVGLQLTPYLFSKFAVLGSLCLVQCLVLLLVTAPSCNWRASWLAMYGFLLTAAWSGLAIGLCLSALARTSEMAVGLLPLVLIPMVVLGGAMLPIRKMPALMRAMTFVTPTRWAYEGMVVSEADAMERQKSRRSAKEPPPGTSSQADIAQRPSMIFGPTPSGLTPGTSSRPDIAERHFPKGERHTPGEAFAWLVLLLCLQVLAAFVILAYRARR
jgi:hypothetical protein